MEDNCILGSEILVLFEVHAPFDEDKIKYRLFDIQGPRLRPDEFRGCDLKRKEWPFSRDYARRVVNHFLEIWKCLEKMKLHSMSVVCTVED
ncbi:hypothetical protein PoB_006602100 [Plakobranchus ocellatus]|uniref:Uncharacterized protein n=1 Tax=Plakobranchus ocellatus TaxID=259542 RepID=A0AAV4D617_9GAST|nr:hypothetical protein PoB_006602100 [Plakobranchus ocellatus]